jgi:hypothetical protein
VADLKGGEGPVCLDLTEPLVEASARRKAVVTCCEADREV